MPLSSDARRRQHGFLATPADKSPVGAKLGEGLAHDGTSVRAASRRGGHSGAVSGGEGGGRVELLLRSCSRCAAVGRVGRRLRYRRNSMTLLATHRVWRREALGSGSPRRVRHGRRRRGRRFAVELVLRVVDTLLYLRRRRAKEGFGMHPRDLPRRLPVARDALANLLQQLGARARAIEAELRERRV